MSNRPVQRFVSASAATLGWFALALQLWLTVQLTRSHGGSTLAGAWIYLDYFTVLTNGVLATALTVDARGPRGQFGRWLMQPESIIAVAASIFIVGMVYNLALRGLWQPTGWQRLADELLHVVMPLLGLGFWWLATAGRRVGARRLLAWLLYPLGYLAYALARGAIDGRYPYPFLEVATLGYPRVLMNAAGVACAFALTGGVLFVVTRWRARWSG
ncbi:MAG: Pr6Pr family membrane protein [Rhodanobacter sp.]